MLIVRTFTTTVLMAASLISGCSYFQNESYEAETVSVAETVKTLPEVVEVEAPVATLSLAELIHQLENVEHEGLEYEVTNRLAQLRLSLMEEQLAEGDGDFKKPIETLRQLKRLAPDKESRARVDYQLARVLEISQSASSRQAQPMHSPVVDALSEAIAATETKEVALESQFRRAEIYFSNNEFSLAEQDFAAVAATTGDYQLHASYMLTWARFKLADLDGTLRAAMNALTRFAESEQENLHELREDLLRVTVLALNDAEGPTSLAKLMTEADKPEWQTDVYRALGDWYLEKDRFADSARTWKTFLAENPVHREAPSIALEVINTQREAGFVADIPSLEQTFITQYGKQADFYQLHGQTVFETYEAPLREMLDRSVQRAHSIAQRSELEADYLVAASAYELWLLNFSNADEAQEKRFLYAEVIEAARGFASAMPQYEMIVLMDPSTDFGREAAYAVVVGLSADIPAFGLEALIDAHLRFAASYPEDSRTPASQLSAAKHLFEIAAYAQAKEVARHAIDLDSDPAYQLIARRIVAHSSFELAEFEQAETIYRELTALGDNHSDRLLASVYRQGEIAENNGALEVAITHFDRLWEIDARAELTRDATYDIAGLYENLNRMDLATMQLERYRQRYPREAERQFDDISRRLVDLRESEGDLEGAARELLAISHRSDGEAARVARYRAAELFLESNQVLLAIEHFRYYAHNFPEPLDIRLEAMHHMDELYQLTGEPAKRDYWLRKKRDAVREIAAEERNDRAKYLAANAVFLLGEKDFQAFQAATLTLPLARSLKKKQALLNRSLATYEELVGLGSYEYVTKGYFRMARLYERLAEDLMSSEPPGGLNDLETEQYEILLEEQAYPFEEKAISLHEKNLSLGWQMGWNDAVKDSLVALQTLSPAKFSRPVQEVSYVD